MEKLFSQELTIINFEVTYTINVKGNKIYYFFGLKSGYLKRSVDPKGYIFETTNGKTYFITERRNIVPTGFNAVFHLQRNSSVPLLDDLQNGKKKLILTDVIDKSLIVSSWKDQFNFKAERVENGVLIAGLRKPQLGALHAILGHWSLFSSPGMIIMPTGTGKTETMLSVLVAHQCSGVLIVVPSDSLRNQTVSKFKTLGVLKENGVVGLSADNPIVSKWSKGIKTIEDAELIFNSNVIVTTPILISALLQGPEVIRSMFLEWCNYLIMDEAHHNPAPQWNKVRLDLELNDIRVLLFTATPFRNDGRKLKGNVLFNYPLSLAQEDGYYQKIEFHSIVQFDRRVADKEIAETAIQLLRKDLQEKLDHILMARVDTKKLAEQLFNDIYSNYQKFNPVYIHSGLPPSEKKAILSNIKAGIHKIIVCVDMLGEGFDLPQLKICALHDLHKNITTSFQFFGRFTRTATKKLGTAKIVANIVDPNLKGVLRKLYSRDSDWNQLISYSNESIIKKVIKEHSFFNEFEDIGIHDKIPIRNIQPAMSTVVYQLFDDISWNPNNYQDYFPESQYETVSLPHKERHLLVVVAKKTTPVKWGKIDDLNNSEYELYILYLNTSQGLLFLNSTNNNSTHRKLAELVVGSNIALFNEAEIYRSLSGIFQLELFNLGLKSILNGPISFTMYAGNGIVEGLDELDNSKASSNLFGVGYENGEKVTIGCSTKGRVWTKLVNSIPDFTEWCDNLGCKLLDSTIDTSDIFKFIQKPERIHQLPEGKIPISINWNEGFFSHASTIKFNGVPIIDYTIRLIDYTSTTIQFSVVLDTEDVRFNQELTEKGSRGFNYGILSGKEPEVEYKGAATKLIDLFYEFPPIIWFHDNSKMYNNIYFPFKGAISIFDHRRILVNDWSKVNVQRESQKMEKRADSIQYHMIQTLKDKEDYCIIFDDDDANEASDIIAIKVFQDYHYKIEFELYHCKYSKAAKAGARLNDLYEVCGQAQRSYHWRHCVLELLTHMSRRNQKRVERAQPSRFEAGSEMDLHTLTHMITSGYCDINFKIFVVQPGISKKQLVDKDHLKLLGATELLLKKTGNAFYVVTSE